MKKVTVNELIDILTKYRDEYGGDDECIIEGSANMYISDVTRWRDKCVISWKTEDELIRESYPKYPLFSEKDEYGETCSQYKGYIIQASYDEDEGEWQVDVFDEKWKQYVLSPLECDSDFGDAIAKTIKRIDAKIKYYEKAERVTEDEILIG